MAQWKETLEPYVKVIESVKSTSLNPTAGDSLILGVVLISDSGPAEPTLIKSQSEFLETYAAEELTKDYIKGLDKFYSGDPGSSLASTMWLNAYRLAGSSNLLVCRATKANGIIYTKSLDPRDSENSYIIKDTEILRSVPSFKFVLDKSKDGWVIAVRDAGKFGNLHTDEGPQYDYFVDNLVDLVDKLNETSKFYSPNYEFFNDPECTIPWAGGNPKDINAVLFKEVYLGPQFIDTEVLNNLEGEITEVPSDGIDTNNVTSGLAYILAVEPEWSYSQTIATGETQDIIFLNSKAYSGFEPIENYVSNLYSSRTELEVTIKRYNHNAVEILSVPDGNDNYRVIPSALASADSYYDFYEFGIKDPSISEDIVYFNVGNLPGRGDVTVEEMLKSLGMIYLNLPSNLSDLGLNYYGYVADDKIGGYHEEDNSFKDQEISVVGSTPEGNENTTYVLIETVEGTSSNISSEQKISLVIEGTAVESSLVRFGTTMPILENESEFYWIKVANEDSLSVDGKVVVSRVVYKGDEVNPTHPHKIISINVSIDGEKSSLLNVSDSEIMQAWDRIEDDERYVVEGFADLGCTYPKIQNYIANIAVNSNYFYAFSTANTTNYMTIASKANKITARSHKLYAAAPWDYDDGTVGFQFAVSPSTLYWETVVRNRINNNEFAGVFGQNTGRVSVISLAKEFKKTERQLLLSKKINTISYDNYLGTHYFNDNYTFTEDSHVLSEECNSRLQIRISKAMPLLLNQFKGRQNTSKTWGEMRDVINYWFRNTIMRYNYTIAEYRIICDETNNTPESIRQNKVFVKIQVRFNSSIKFITVYNDAYPIGVEFDEN